MRLPARLKRSRHGIFYFRLLIPKRFRHCFGGRAEIQHSLHTRDPHIARHWAICLAARLMELWGDGVADDDKRAKLNRPMQGLDLTSRWTIDTRKGIFSADPTIPGDQKGFMDAFALIANANPKVFDPPPAVAGGGVEHLDGVDFWRRNLTPVGV